MAWTDDTFPAQRSSLHHMVSNANDIKWIRPKDLDKNACLRGCTTSLPVQGSLGDCWLICAFYALARSEEAWKKVFGSSDQDLSAGRVVVNLWIDGNWTKVEIDDRLPFYTKDGRYWKILYCHNADKAQYWASLLEKACAKVYGGYQMLVAGQPSEGYLLVTGGYTWTEIVERSKFEVVKSKVDYLLKCSETKNRNCVFLSCSYTDKTSSERDTLDKSSEHCYCVFQTDFQNNQGKNYLRLWDPRSNKLCVSGWSEQKIYECSSGITFATTNLTKVLNDTNKKWSEKILKGKWTVMSSCGGCRSSSSFGDNPQYVISVSRSKECFILHCTLIQSSKRYCVNRKELLQSIGMHVFQTTAKPKTPLTSQQLKSLSCIGALNPEYKYSQDISLVVCVNLSSSDCSTLLLIPSMFSKDAASKFTLRVAGNVPFQINQL